MALLVTYDLKGGGREDYAELYAELKSLGTWWHHLESSWIIVTDENPTQLWLRLKPHFGEGDHVLILDIDFSDRQGLLPRRAWEWIRKHVPAPE